MAMFSMDRPHAFWGLALTTKEGDVVLQQRRKIFQQSTGIFIHQRPVRAKINRLVTAIDS
jgi:23S rRNA G2069 N7-methylase RlmK/C1962 C5-methylase RlmI